MVSNLTSEDFVLSFPLAVNESDLLNHPWDSISMGSEEMEFCIVTYEAAEN